MHEIDDENGDITQVATATSQVGERLVTGRIDEEDTVRLHLQLATEMLTQFGRLLDQVLTRQEGSTNLLGDTTGFTSLDIRLTNTIENLGLT